MSICLLGIEVWNELVWMNMVEVKVEWVISFKEYGKKTILPPIDEKGIDYNNRKTSNNNNRVYELC